MRAAAFVLATLLTAPAFARFRCPAEGGDAWHEYRTEHFVIDTDVSELKAGLLAKQLETLHAMQLQAMVGEVVEIPGHLRVIAFADPRDFADLAGSSYVGGYFRLTQFGPMMVLPVDGMEADREVIAHELAHYLSRFLFPQQPLWFAEGLAAFYQTVANPGDENQPEIGSHVRRGGRTLGGAVGLMPRELMSEFAHNARPVPAKEILAWKKGEDTASPGRLHSWSWLLYHYLWNQRGKQFTDFQKRMQDGEAPESAWRAALPDLDPVNGSGFANLDRALDGYRKSARYAFYRVKADVSPKMAAAPLPSADVHVLRVEARMAWPEDPAVLRRAELNEALREDGTHAAALALRAAADPKVQPDLDALRKAAAAHGNDWYGWMLLGQLLPDGQEKEAAYRRSAELNPDNANSQNNLAWLLVQAGRAKEALPFANRALDLVPSQSAYIDTLAHVADGLGKCAEALALERRAVAVRQWSGGDAEAMKRELAKMEERCRK